MPKTITFFSDTGMNYGGILRAFELFKELGIERDEDEHWKWHFQDFQELLVMKIIENNQVDFTYIIED